MLSKDTTSVLCHDSLVLGQLDSSDTFIISGLASQGSVVKPKNHNLQLLLTPEQLTLLGTPGTQYPSSFAYDPLADSSAPRPSLVEVTCRVESINYIYDTLAPSVAV